ncbi:MAG: hypothetical protein K8G79_09050 [bacterium]|uniref:Uncharacterized protein n=1 Tax=Candidatus Methylomirabilis tolerans TaxID=3123416 RepID=A0AAJ1AKQ6_9BACT|nr:hypothetical protein [Candidatus Methylomirabilis sp.]
MDYHVFSKELEELRGCQFLYVRDSRKIESLVQSYLDSPELHSLECSRQLLYHLLNSEYAPLQRFARTGLQPDGFWVRRFPRVGPWIVYAGVITMWVLSIIIALSLRGSMRQSLGTWALVVLMTGFIAHYLRGWLRLRTITNEARGLFDHEILHGHFDPTTLSDRLHALEHKGLKVHANAFVLLQLQQRLQGPPTGTNPPAS